MKYLLCGTLHILLVFVFQARNHPNCTISQQYVCKISEVLCNSLLVNVPTYKRHKNLNQISRQVTILDLRVLNQNNKVTFTELSDVHAVALHCTKCPHISLSSVKWSTKGVRINLAWWLELVLPLKKSALLFFKY